MTHSLLARRSVLRGAAGVTLALPAFGRAAADERPKRFVGFFTPNGHPPAAWRPPSGDEYTFALPSTLKPLGPHRKHLLLLDGVSMRSSRTTGPAGIGTALTGTRPGGGISLDQALATSVGMRTPVPSLELGVMLSPARSTFAGGHLSWSAAGVPLPPVDEPEAVFKRLFAAPMDAGRLRLLLARRASVLDAVEEGLAGLRPRLVGEDRRRLEAHTEAVREMERQLAPMAAARASCGRSMALPTHAPRDPAQLTVVRDLMIDLVVAALACDQTRVATLVIGGAASALTFPALQLGTAGRGGWTEIAVRQDRASASAHSRISLWCAEGFARLISRLEGTLEATGPLLDRVVLLWNTDCNPDRSHDDVPLLIAGSCGGALRTGRWVRQRAGTSHNDLLVSLMRAMGVETSRFGDPGYCTGALPQLT